MKTLGEKRFVGKECNCGIMGLKEKSHNIRRTDVIIDVTQECRVLSLT
ncbi:MAG: hypothetical protein MJY54_00915 [archaeon]|nr:hypothetical protein [archaeon]